MSVLTIFVFYILILQQINILFTMKVYDNEVKLYQLCFMLSTVHVHQEKSHTAIHLVVFRVHSVV